MPGKHTVFMVCEVSRAVGYGHFKRCLALAGIYHGLGYDIVFVMPETAVPAVQLISGQGTGQVAEQGTEQGTGQVAGQVAAQGMTFMIRKDLADCLRLVGELSTRAALAVIDHYGIDADLEKTIFGVVPVLVIDDLCRPHHCDVLMDQTLGRQPEAYADKLFSPHASVLAGSRYTLIDPLYRGVHSTRNMEEVLISFGATDPLGWGLEVLKILERHGVGRHLVFHLPLSSAAPNRQTLEKFAAESALDIRLYWDLPDLAGLYRRCGLGVGAPGTSLLERIFCGLVNLTLVVADNQEAVGRQVADRGAAVSLGQARHLDEGYLVEMLDRLIRDQGMAERLRQKGCLLVDGRGGQRVAGATLEKIAPVSLRPADRADKMFLFRLQHETGARQYFFNPAPPDSETHTAWFDGVLSDPRRELYVIEWNREKVGYLRLDTPERDTPERGAPYEGVPKEDPPEVSIMIRRKFQGVGLAGQALKQVLAWGNRRYTARIQPANTASVNLFTSAGFVPGEKGRYHYHGGSV